MHGGKPIPNRPLLVDKIVQGENDHKENANGKKKRGKSKG